MSNFLNLLSELEKKVLTIGIQGEKGEQKKLIRTISAGANLKEVKSNLKSAGVEIKGRLNRSRVDTNLTVARVAHWMEFGTKKNGKQVIPPRPFIGSIIRNQKSKILLAAKRILLSQPEHFHELLGGFIVGLANKQISDKIFAANSPKTIQRKGSDTPLVDFGQLRNALTFKVSDK